MSSTKSSSVPNHRRRQPAIDDSMTIEKIRAAIPAQYMKQDTLHSMFYLVTDLLQVFAWGWFCHQYLIPSTSIVYDNLGYYPGVLASIVAWNVYWFIQGLNMGGLWVLAHECGHGGFSSIPAVNTTVGWLVHSALLVPYQAWKISHATHHRQCNNIEKDTVFLPDEKPSALKEAIVESPIVSTFYILVMFTLGWPFHLLINMAGNTFQHRGHKGRINHFEPTSPLFRKEEREQIIIADLGVLLCVACLWYASSLVGASTVFFWYGVPYLWVNQWLVGVTFLQHTDFRIPHYSQEKFSFVKGALATVDRDFGWFCNWKLHHIQDSHVAHHLFSTMPFYHAKHVTDNYIKPVLGDLYVADTDRSYLAMIWDSWRECRYVVPSEGVTFFRR